MKKIIVSSLLLSALFFSACSGTDNTQTVGQAIAPVIIKLQNKQVCMVNDRFMNKDQTPVPVNNKTYYGCCEGCVAALLNNPTSRYALDALTHQRVDKADAVIVRNPNTEDGVLYFASEVNAIAYLKDNAVE